MTLHRKSVILKDWNMYRDIHKIPLTKGMDVLHKQISFKNKESYLTIVHDNKEDINKLLSEFPILSDRARTLKNIPKYRIINTVKETIN